MFNITSLYLLRYSFNTSACSWFTFLSLFRSMSPWRQGRGQRMLPTAPSGQVEARNLNWASLTHLNLRSGFWQSLKGIRPQSNKSLFYLRGDSRFVCFSDSDPWNVPNIQKTVGIVSNIPWFFPNLWTLSFSLRFKRVWRCTSALMRKNCSVT